MIDIRREEKQITTRYSGSEQKQAHFYTYRPTIDIGVSTSTGWIPIPDVLVDTGALFSVLKIEINKGEFENEINTLWEQLKETYGISYDDLGLYPIGTATRETIITPVALIECKIVGEGHESQSTPFNLPCGLIPVRPETNATDNENGNALPLKDMLLSLSGLIVGDNVEFIYEIHRSRSLKRTFNFVSFTCLPDKNEVSLRLA